MKLDCGSCTQRDIACGDCVVSLFLSLPQGQASLNEEEIAAVEVMADAGLVPHLRMTPEPGDMPKHLRIVS